MHILLTDVLSCPRCGPRFGLILLADRMDDRWVVEGRLGCANCREEFVIERGVADLRFPPGAEPLGATAPEVPQEAAFRLAALLGVADRAGTVLLVGATPELAGEVARLLPAATIVAAGAGGGGGSSGGVSWIRLGGLFPFRDRSVRAVGVRGELTPELLDQVVRVLAPGGNVVVDPAPPGAAGELVSRGLVILLEQDGVVVASPPVGR